MQDRLAQVRIEQVRPAQICPAQVRFAQAMGISLVPSLYRDGTPVLIRTTPAVAKGSALKRLEIIDAMLDDDGLWELSKP